MLFPTNGVVCCCHAVQVLKQKTSLKRLAYLQSCAGDALQDGQQDEQLSSCVNYCPDIDGQATPDDLHACAALQFWTPTILAERGVRDLRILGLASAAPWAVTA